MREARWIAGVSVAMIVSCSAPNGASRVPAGITVGPNVQVSVAQSSVNHGEVLVSADASDPRRLIACSMAATLPVGSWISSGSNAAYMSSDGGRTWSLVYQSRLAGDPVCAFGTGNFVYVGGASLFIHHDWIARSSDGGEHWNPAAIFPWGDRDFIAVDTTHSSFRGRVYDAALNTVRRGNALVAPLGERYSTDNGFRFSQAVRVFANARPQSGTEYGSGPIVVLRNGHVVDLAYVWPDSPAPKNLGVFVSSDGGNSFVGPRLVATRAGSTLLRGQSEAGVSPVPVIATDTSRGPFSGRIYVAWQDFQKYDIGKFVRGTYFFGLAYPASQAAIMLSYSDDEGKTWSAPTEVDDAPSWPSRRYPGVFGPAIAVNDKGIVAVTWYDARGIADGTGGAVRMAVSSDGGETFSRSFAVSTAPTLITPKTTEQALEAQTVAGYTRFAVDLRFNVFGQDTQGLCADAAGAFHPVWVDNRTGVAQLWTSSVSVARTAMRRGDASLSHATEVTNDFVLVTDRSNYDARTQSVTADVALMNASRRSIPGPIQLRITRMTSAVGTPSIVQPPGDESGAGALLTFTPARGRDVLPHSETAARRLVFRVSRSHALSPSDGVVLAIPYISLQYRIYTIP
jgi:hypothetical protein